MANVIETGTYDAGVYQIETTDPVVGGAAGIANRQAIALANRTKFLLGKVNASLRFDSVITTSAPYTITPADVSKLLYISNMASSGFTFPAASSFPQNQPFTIKASDIAAIAPVAFTPNGSDKFFDGSVVGGSSSYSIHAGETITLMAVGSLWYIVEVTQSGRHSRVPAGATIAFAGSTAPNGWLKCDGAAISRTGYADLFAAIGTTWGTGNGTTTFNLPDHRGVFLRGLDEGRGLDIGRGIGTFQLDDVGAHTHVLNTSGVSASTGSAKFASAVQTDTPRIITDPTGGIETTVKNNACPYIIKF